jgi:hypothetical protein
VAGKGLKQGDPISPILFNLVADVFSEILFKAATNHLICGLLPQAIPGVSLACSTLMTPSFSFRKTWGWLEI